MPFLPECYPLLFFYVHCTLEIHSAGEKLHSILDELETVFPGSIARHQQGEDGDDLNLRDARDGEENEGGCSIIKGLRALVYYHVRGTRAILTLIIDELFRSLTEYYRFCRFR